MIESRQSLWDRSSISRGTAWISVLAIAILRLQADTHYVDANSAAPVSPYTNWATAARVIQDAVDVSSASDTVLVTNGIYLTGGRAVHGAMTNRVAVDRPVVLRSVNGPEVTLIQGYQIPGTTNGDGAVRCVYLTSGAVLAGFTLTNGATQLSGDPDTNQSGGGVWCEGVSAVVTNCIIVGNAASYRGGGGRAGFWAYCNVVANWAVDAGGGVSFGTLNDCILAGNFAHNGGGAFEATMTRCTLTSNSAFLGGGASGGYLNGCALAGNSAETGGGAYAANLDNCTLTGNSALTTGGGAYCDPFHQVNNCILYYNTAGANPNYDGDTLNYCCTTPAPSLGFGTITEEPQLASRSHLSSGSPCRGAGNPFYSSGVDIDGESWLDPPAMGCDEYRIGSVTGLLSVALTAPLTNVTLNGTLDFTALINGRVSDSVWDFGDGSTSSNRPYASHSWSAPGDYEVALTAYNEDHPGGVSATVTVSVIPQPVYYVSAANTNPVPPYSSWATAALTIQDAVDAATTAGALILVTNGVYASGGRTASGQITNRVAVDKPLILQSVNGPEVTVIQGYQVPVTTNGDGAIRCVYLGSGAVLSGFTLTNGATRFVDDATDTVLEEGGGGVLCESDGSVVTNCVLTGNSAYLGGGASFGRFENCRFAHNTAGFGAGLFYGTASNCTLTYNTAQYGGGAYNGTFYSCVFATNSAGYGGGAYATEDDKAILNNCTLVGNSSAIGSGGGAFRGTLRNCILYYNTAGMNPNYEGGLLSFCCTTPAPGSGAGNLTNAPGFVNAPAGDYRLSPTSPCLDAGINQEWMFEAVDRAGNSRLLNGTVDLGAYETPFTLELRVFLQGAYDTNTHTMVVGDPGNVSTTSPYAADLRQALTVTSNVVDWVLVELRSTNGSTVVARSTFLDAQGQVQSTTGTTGITAEVSSGDYSLVVKHRNHLAVMSAQPVAFTNYLTTYDFTPAATRYAGGGNAAVELEPNVWGMLAGDADGDGEILAVDRSFVTNQYGLTGYQRADFNLDGVVSSNDLALWMANQGRSAPTAAAETILSPALIVSPERKTLLPGDPLTLTVTGNAGAANWAIVKNPSGGLLTNLTSTSTGYRAGFFSNQVDIVQAWDSQGRLGRAYVNVISPDEVAKVGKGIVVAGRRSGADPLWPVTDYLGDLAYNTLLYRGYSKVNLRYLSPVTDQDVDGNGEMDDVALPSTLTNVASTLTNWAANPDRMFIYLVDHGGSVSGEGYFRLNESETLTASQLDEWLDAVQLQYSNDVVVVIDCCEAGSFLAPLSYHGPGTRTVITACATNEPTYFVAGGLVSFSDTFFGGILLGLDLEDAFVLARDAMSTYQRSWMDADGNGLYESGTDPALLADRYLGPSFVAGKDIPQIGHVMGNQLLEGASQATLWAYEVVSVYPLDRVWCVVVPPGHSPNPLDPVADLPSLELSYQASSGRYEASYGGFTEVGNYKLVYYARDIWGSISLPRQSSVTQNAFDERVILVAGGSTNDARWGAMDRLAQMAYRTFQGRRVDREKIYYLNPVPYQDVDGDGNNNINALPTLSNLESAVTSWTSNANKLTVYLIGPGTNGLFRMNESENLSPADLNAWLNLYQSSNAEVAVVLDFPGSGAFVPALQPPVGRSRITMASTEAGHDCLFANGGIVSFSQYFLSEVSDGLDLGSAFKRTREVSSRASGPLRQHALLDDDGDGLSGASDGDFSGQRYIGTAFLTGADRPGVGTATPNPILRGTATSLLWISEVTDVEGISNVWCVITPPNYSGGDLPQTNLTWNALTGRYEAVYTNFTQPGTYVCTFYAQNDAGEVSSAKQADVVVTYTSPADGRALASSFQVGDTEAHELDSALAEIWVKFYAPTGMIFNVEVEQLGTNSDLQLDLYHEEGNGSLTFAGSADKFGAGVGFIERLTVDLKTGASGLLPGLYYVRASSANTNLFGPGSDYELRIYVPIGGSGGVPFPGVPDLGGLLPLGSFYVYLGPPQALAAGAGWRLQPLTNETYYHTSVLYDLPASPAWTLSFREIPGFVAPANRPLVIEAEKTTSAMAYYVYTNASPRADSPVIGPNGELQVSFVAPSGRQYAIEQSTNLLDWIPMLTNQVPQDGLLHFNWTNLSTGAHGFYRARWVP